MAQTVAMTLDNIWLMPKIEKQTFSTVKCSTALLLPTAKKRKNRFENNYFFLITVIREVPAGKVVNLWLAASAFRKLVKRVFINNGTLT